MQVNHGSSPSLFQPIVRWEQHLAGVVIHLSLESELRFQGLRALGSGSRIDLFQQPLDMG